MIIADSKVGHWRMANAKRKSLSSYIMSDIEG